MTAFLASGKDLFNKLISSIEEAKITSFIIYMKLGKLEQLV